MIMLKFNHICNNYASLQMALLLLSLLLVTVVSSVFVPKFERRRVVVTTNSGQTAYAKIKYQLKSSTSAILLVKNLPIPGVWDFPGELCRVEITIGEVLLFQRYCEDPVIEDERSYPWITTGFKDISWYIHTILYLVAGFGAISLISNLIYIFKSVTKCLSGVCSCFSCLFCREKKQEKREDREHNYWWENFATNEEPYLGTAPPIPGVSNSGNYNYFKELSKQKERERVIEEIRKQNEIKDEQSDNTTGTDNPVYL